MFPWLVDNGSILRRLLKSAANGVKGLIDLGRHQGIKERRRG